MPHILGTDGFTVLVVSEKDGHTKAKAITGGSVSTGPALEHILAMVLAVSTAFGATVNVTREDCGCPECQEKHAKQPIH